MNSRHGLSLIELVIVIAVIGILVAIGGIGGASLLQSSRLNSAVNSVETQIALARRLAKETDSVVEFAVVDTEQGWSVRVGNRAMDLQGVSVTTGNIALDLQPPYGTYVGNSQMVGLRVGNKTAEVEITGVFARTVVHR